MSKVIAQAKVVFQHSNYRDALRALLNPLLESGESYRTLSQKCELSSPNFFQKILSGERNLTFKSAQKDCGWFGLG